MKCAKPLNHLWLAVAFQLQAENVRTMRIAAAISALLLVPGLSSATTLQQLSLDDMIRKSSEIVHGTVQCSGAAWRGSTLYTNYRVQVVEQWKGASAMQLDFSVPGGALNGIRQTYAGAPAIAEGQDVLLFLWTSKSGLRQVIGLSQGLFTLTARPDGQLFVSRGAATEIMLGPNGQPVQDAGFSMLLSDLRSRVANTLAGRSQ